MVRREILEQYSFLTNTACMQTHSIFSRPTYEQQDAVQLPENQINKMNASIQDQAEMTTPK